MNHPPCITTDRCTTPTYPSIIHRRQQNPSDFAHCVPFQITQQKLSFNFIPHWLLTFNLKGKEWKSVSPAVSGRQGCCAQLRTESPKCIIDEEQRDAVCWVCLHSNILWRRNHLCQSCSAHRTRKSSFCCIWLKASHVYLLVQLGIFFSPQEKCTVGLHETQTRNDQREIVCCLTSKLFSQELKGKG